MRRFSVIAEGTLDYSVHVCHKFRSPAPSPFPEKNPRGSEICFQRIYFREEKGKAHFVQDICGLAAEPGTRIRILSNGGKYKIEFPEETKRPA